MQCTELQFMSRSIAERSVSALSTYSPESWEDFLNLSSAFFVLGDSALATANARRALTLNRNPATLLNLAVILESQSKFYTALSLSKEAYRLAPDDSIVACQYSDALL